MMRRLQQKIAASAKRRNPACPQSIVDFRDQMHVGAVTQGQPDTLVIENQLQLVHAAADVRTAVFIQAGIDVWRAKSRLDTVFGCNTSHLQRRRERWRAIIDAGEEVAVDVNHGLSTSRTTDLRVRR